MARRSSQAQGQSVAPFILLGGVGAAGWAVYQGYPGLALLWAAALIAAIAEPPVMFTGPKVGGYPTPAAGEEKAARDFEMAKDLKWRLIVPNVDWLPGWTPRSSWLVAVALGVLATLAPITDAGFVDLWWVPAVTTAVLIWQTTGSKRRTATPKDPHPGVKVAALKDAGPAAVISGLVGAGVFAAAVSYLIDHELISQHLDSPLPTVAYLSAGAVLGFVSGSWWKWKPVALAEWEEMVATRSEWDARWEVMFKAAEQKPHLIGHRTVGRLTVDTFAAPATIGALGVINMSMKIRQAVGSGMEATIVNVPATDAQGQPMPGTAHPLNFEVVSYPSGQTPDITDPITTVEEAGYVVTSALSKAIDTFGQGGARMNMVSCQPLHATGPQAEEEKAGLVSRLASSLKGRKKQPASQPADGEHLESGDGTDGATDPASSSPAAWAFVFQGVDGAAVWVRSSYAGIMADHLGTPVLADERNELVFAGALIDQGTHFIDSPAPTGEEWDVYLANLSEEDEWNGRWGQALKMGANPPQPQFAVKRQARLGQATLYSQPFLTKQGIDWKEYQKLEPKLSTTLVAAPFVSIVGYPAQRGKPGERHPQAFAVRWSDGPVPTSADRITPSEETRSNQSTMSTAQHWVLAGHINAAFDSARLPRPEVISTRPLTATKARGHIWRIDLRLFDGVTLAHVRGALGKLTTSMGVPWLRVAPGPDASTATIVAGVDFRKTRLEKKTTEAYLIDLDWQQAFADSGVTGVGGLLPRMLGADTMPKNPSVHILDFELPAGVSVDDVKKGLPKLKGATKNGFVQVQPGVHGAASIRLLASEEDPMPKTAPVDFTAIDESSVIPFATGVDGEYIEYDWKDSPHLLIVGATGGGKSVSLQALIYGLLVRGADLYVADPSKGGADFKFATPWMKAFADKVEDTSAMLDAAYAEVLRRKDLNAKHGAGNYRELPEEVRPPHAVVVLDEFTSLISKDKLRKPDSDDPEVLRDFEANVAKNAAVDNIGSKVGRIAREARSAGFTLLLATQRLTAKILEDLPGGADLRTNMARMILGKATFGELQSALKNPMAAPDLGEVVPPGRGMFEPMAGATQIIQSWFIPNMQDEFSAALSERRPALEPDELVDLDRYRPKKRELEVEGEIIDGPPTRRSRRAAPKEPVVIDAGSLELSLEDLEAFADTDGEGEAQDADLPAPDAAPLGAGRQDVAVSADGFGDDLPQESGEDLDWSSAFGGLSVDSDDLVNPGSSDDAESLSVEDLDSMFSAPAAAGHDEEPAPFEPPRSALTAADAILGPVDSPAAPATTEEPFFGSLEPEAGRVLILGVEGVLTPAGPEGTEEWGEADIVDAGMFGEVRVWPKMIAQLRGPWRKVWLTDWEEAAAHFLGDRLDAQVAHPVGKDGMGWKMATLESLLNQPDVKRVVWVNGEPGEDMLGMSPAELATEMAADAGVDLTVVEPHGPVLSPAEVDVVRKALRAPDADRSEQIDDVFSAPVPSFRLPDPFAD